ncbi:MAG: outer membrane protein assembly factor BamA, partial [Candidatus Firestonebacteria bacterium]|nr:outer membrane protein assembly factor BamA [Candidatus Firestonebacteria bacterium]
MRRIIFWISILFCISLNIYNILGNELIPINPPVTAFTFFGNKTFKSSKLSSITELGKTSIFKIPQFTDEEMAKDLSRIKSFYNANGFLFVSVEPIVKFGPGKTWAEIMLHIKEGVRTKISNIKIEGINNFKLFEIESQIETKTNTYFNHYQIQEDKKKILMFYNNHGYIYAMVNHLLKFNEDNTHVELTFLIEERQVVYIDKINISGLNLTKEKIVTREIEIEEGDILLWQKLVDTQKNINNLGIFSDVRFEPAELDETKNRINLILHLKEQPPRYFAFGLGYGSIDKQRILLEWSHENLFGENQRIHINATFKSWEDLYNISFINPHILDTKNSLITSSSYRRTIRQDYKVGEISASSDIRRKLTKYIIGSAKYKLQRTDLFAILETAPEEIKLDKKVSLTQSFIYTLIRDTRDSMFYPTKGMLHTVSYQYAGGILSGDNTFKRYIYNGSLFFNLWDQIVLGYGIQTGFIKEFGRSKFVPVEEKFHASGVNTVRGYGENEIGPREGENAVLISNLELRFPIYKKLFGVIFYDGGDFADKLDEIKNKTMR